MNYDEEGEWQVWAICPRGGRGDTYLSIIMKIMMIYDENHDDDRYMMKIMMTMTII